MAASLRMQVTLDLPDDAFAKADAVARQEARSLGSVLTDLIRTMKPGSLPKGEVQPLGPMAMLGYARQFQVGSVPSTDEIMRELRAGDQD